MTVHSPKTTPLVDAGKEIASFQEVMHNAVTAVVVLLSIASLVVLIVAKFKGGEARGTGVYAAVALAKQQKKRCETRTSASPRWPLLVIHP